MAELLIGPLLNLGIYLGKWVWKKYRENGEAREHTREAEELVSVVQKLALFAHEKASEIKGFHHDFGLRSNSLGIL
jgi:hypothetical protein